MFGNRVLSPEASESPAERLQGNYSAHQPPPPGFRRSDAMGRFRAAMGAAACSEAVATTGKEIELRGGHQIGPISASGIAVSCLGGLRGPENRAPFLVRLSSIRSDMTRIVAG